MSHTQALVGSQGELGGRGDRGAEHQLLTGAELPAATKYDVYARFQCQAFSRALDALALALDFGNGRAAELRPAECAIRSRRRLIREDGRRQRTRSNLRGRAQRTAFCVPLDGAHSRAQQEYHRKA